jgi:hypothetical protein
VLSGELARVPGFKEVAKQAASGKKDVRHPGGRSTAASEFALVQVRGRRGGMHTGAASAQRVFVVRDVVGQALFWLGVLGTCGASGRTPCNARRFLVVVDGWLCEMGVSPVAPSFLPLAIQGFWLTRGAFPCVDTTMEDPVTRRVGFVLVESVKRNLRNLARAAVPRRFPILLQVRHALSTVAGLRDARNSCLDAVEVVRVLPLAVCRARPRVARRA